MKKGRALAVILVFLLAGMVMLSGLMIRQEQQRALQELIDRGVHLATLISLYPVDNLRVKGNDALPRLLAEYLAPDKVSYLFIHDATGRVVMQFDPRRCEASIPEEVRLASQHADAAAWQTFRDPVSSARIYEFTSPMLDKAGRAGTVRLGIHVPSVVYLSPTRISVLATICFLLVGAMVIGYYLIVVALGKLRIPVSAAPGGDVSATGTNTVAGLGIVTAVEQMDRLIGALKSKLQVLQGTNVDLQATLGASAFEKRRIERMLDSINMGVIIIDRQDRVCHMNQPVLNLLKTPPRQITDRPLAEVLPNPAILSFLAKQEEVGSYSRADHVDAAFPTLAPGQEFRVTAAAFSDADGTPLGRTITIRNTTKERMAEKTKQDFIAHLAHELRNPLTSIKSYNELLMNGEITTDDMKKEFHNTISQETDRLTRLVKDFLDISRMELGSMTLKKTRVKTDWLVEDCLPILESAAAKKHITIRKTLPAVFPAIMADKELLKVAVVNLLGNAVKYTPDSGSVVFSISDRDGYVLIEVTDTGYGISETDLPHIFEKFYRADNPSITSQTGTGLGLTITAEIIKLHGGEITVESELGKGSHFTIRLPKEEFYVGNTPA